jgi:hypothetical protein
MEIDLNNPNDFTRERVRELIGSGDDSKNTQLRVSNDGRAYISYVVGAEEIEDLCFRLETSIAGNGYVGPDAANDDDWIDRVYKVLQENWPNAKGPKIDVF